MKIDITKLRNGRANDHAIVDLLQLIALDMVPGSPNVRELRELWCCSQSQVSRRMNAIGDLGVCRVTSGWGFYRVTDEPPLPKPARQARPDPEGAARRWENLRRRWREVVA